MTTNETMSKAPDEEIGASRDLPDFLKNPGRIDKVLIAGVIVMSIYSVLNFFTRTNWLDHPWLLCGVNGSLTGIIISGAHVREMHSNAVIPAVLYFIGVFKFMPLFWGIGRYWGDAYLTMSGLEHTRMVKIIRRWEHRGSLTHFGLLFLAYVPFCPIPSTVVNLFIGNAREPFWKMFLMNLVCISWVAVLFEWLGWKFGHDVLRIVTDVSGYMRIIGYATLVVTVLAIVRGKRRSAE